MTVASPLSSPLAIEYEAFANGFAFRFVRPHDPVTGGWLRVTAWCRRVGVAFDLLNTRFPTGSAGVRAAIKPVCRVPRMSTPAIGALINRGVAGMAPREAFVNVGVWNGFTFLSGMARNSCKVCIGVDNFSQFCGPKDTFLARFERFKSPNHRFHDMDYKEYFASVHWEPIGFYFYDGEHSYQNQLDGLRIAEPFFAPNCLCDGRRHEHPGTPGGNCGLRPVESEPVRDDPGRDHRSEHAPDVVERDGCSATGG